MNKLKSIGFIKKLKANFTFSGFTLIELLVVIAIIGFIATLAVTAFNSARIQGRDAQRAADVSTIVKALNFYLDSNQGFPASSGQCLTGSSGVGQLLVSATNIIVKVPLDPLYPAVAPTAFHGGATQDYPIAPSANFCFWYYSNSISNFYISYYLETNSKAGNQGINVRTVAGPLSLN